VFKYSDVVAKNQMKTPVLIKCLARLILSRSKNFPLFQQQSGTKKNKPKKIYYSSNFYNNFFTSQQNGKHVSQNGSFLNYVSENRVSNTNNIA